MAFGHQREQGRRILLREIERRGPIPRIDLSHNTGISRATVTTVTAELLRDGLIQEIPRDSENAADLKRGRPRVDLKIAGAAHLVAGIKVSDRSVSLMSCHQPRTNRLDRERIGATDRIIQQIN